MNAFALLLWVIIAGIVILSACSHNARELERSLKVLSGKRLDLSLWAKLEHWDELLQSFVGTVVRHHTLSTPCGSLPVMGSVAWVRKPMPGEPCCDIMRRNRRRVPRKYGSSAAAQPFAACRKLFRFEGCGASQQPGSEARIHEGCLQDLLSIGANAAPLVEEWILVAPAGSNTSGIVLCRAFPTATVNDVTSAPNPPMCKAVCKGHGRTLWAMWSSCLYR